MQLVALMLRHACSAGVHAEAWMQLCTGAHELARRPLLCSNYRRLCAPVKLAGAGKRSSSALSSSSPVRG